MPPPVAFGWNFGKSAKTQSGGGVTKPEAGGGSLCSWYDVATNALSIVFITASNTSGNCMYPVCQQCGLKRWKHAFHKKRNPKLLGHGRSYEVRDSSSSMVVCTRLCHTDIDPTRTTVGLRDDHDQQSKRGREQVQDRIREAAVPSCRGVGPGEEYIQRAGRPRFSVGYIHLQHLGQARRQLHSSRA